MSLAELEQRPAKKRRFFVEDSPTEEDASSNPKPSSPSEQDAFIGIARSDDERQEQDHRESSPPLNGFDVDLLSSFVGEQLPEDTVLRLKDLSGGDIQRAINIYLDGSWKAPQQQTQRSDRSFGSSSIHRSMSRSFSPSARPEANKTPYRPLPRDRMPQKRYVGAFGVTAWATKSGSGLLAFGEKVGIERTKPTTPPAKVGKGGKVVRTVNSKRQDVVVRFTNSKGEEVGRLENDTAAWISTLMDQQLCCFEGTCVFSPDRLRTNDTVYLQLRCFLLKSAFDARNSIKPLESNRETGIFEAKESTEEKNLRLRQVAMVKLFDEINLHPTKVNSQAEKHKRQGLLRAAETAEKQEQQVASQVGKPSDNGGSSPPSEEVEEGEELEQDQLDALYEKAQSFDFNTPEAEPAETFNLSLRKYQKQALHWMLSKEREEKLEHKQQSMHPLWEEYAWPVKDVDEKELPELTGLENFYVNPYSGELSLDFPVQEQNCLGGILADEMGLGKTIEMLSLMHTHKAELDMPAGGASVNDLPRLPKTSTGVERAPATTLVIAPMSLLAQWQSEAEKASKTGTLKSLVYYGTEKNANLRNLCCEANAANAPNLIITSYGVVLSELNQVTALGGNRAMHGGLFSLEYFRVILDEAHFIKNRLSKTAKACYELKAIHRWVLTGTPIVNRLEDLFSLVHFLKVEPWSNFSFWKTFITVPFESKDFIRALDVVQTVLEPLVLRRTKDMKTPDGKALVPLPPRTIEIDKIELSKAEREVYEHIYLRAKRTFNANVEAGTLMKSYTTIFAQILRLRQSCCHPVLTRNKSIVADEDDAAAAADMANGLADDMDLDTLIAAFTAETDEQDANKFGAAVLQQIQAEASTECPLCLAEPMAQQCVTGCWHSACKQCLLGAIAHQRDKGDLPLCFSCRAVVSPRDVFEVVRHDSFDGEDAVSPRISLRRVAADASAKIAALLAHLHALRQEQPGAKSVVFSQFTSFLDLIEPVLGRAGIRFVRLDGSVSQKNRAAIVAAFNGAAGGLVLLLSLRAGGVGLNLTAARRVFMMEPWWSYAVEAQAIDRVHRMGQEHAVRVTRFVVEGSIEEKMIKVQERKKFIASSLGMMSEEEKRVQRIEDIRELLS